jgi:hypothetical protein
MTLAKRVERFPELGAALETGRIGYESALLVGQVLGGRPKEDVSPAVVRAWVERAAARTVVHLREEVRAVVFERAADKHAPLLPPGPERLAAAAELERKVQSGELYRSLLGRVKGPEVCVTLKSPLLPDRVLRLTVPADQGLYWEALERQFHRYAGEEASFIAFACFALWGAWLPYLEAIDDKWIELYRRDRFRCQNPVCGRYNVTPHHLRYRGNGKEEEGDTVGICDWCHLDGIHGGKLTAQGDAPALTWTIGEEPIMRVVGRERE